MGVARRNHWRVGSCVVLTALAAASSGGCWNFPPEAVPYVGSPAAFRPVTGNDLGAAHAYVVGISPERLQDEESARAMRASLRAETVPSAMLPGVVVPVPAPNGATPASSAELGPRAGSVGLTTRPAFQADAGLRQEAAKAIDSGSTGERDLTPTASGDRPAAAQAPLPTTRAQTAATADLNFDGYVTLDEIIALHRAGVSAAEIDQRLRATGYELHATYTQLQHLRAFGLPDEALAAFRPERAGARPPLAETEMR